MEKFVQLNEKFGLEGEKLLEFVEKQQALEEKRRQLEEEKEEKRRQFEEEKEEKRRRLEEERRQEEEEKEERRRREEDDRETRRQERELRELEREVELMRQREAAEAAKREHELELARLAAANGGGHKAVNCPTMTKKCFLCGKQGHLARNCRSSGPMFGGQSKDGNPGQHGEVSASCLVISCEVKPTEEEVESCNKDEYVWLPCGKKIPLLSSACIEPLTGVRSKMPVVKGRVGEKSVDVLRDTGCRGIVVKKDLVSEDQFTGEFNVMLLIDNTARKVPIAKINVDTPYLKGQVEAQCLPDPIYDLVVGNVPGARAADDPDPNWQDHVQEEQVRGVEREESMKQLQDLLNDERRRLNDVRDALDKEMRLTKQLKEKLTVEKLLKSEVERELAEVTKSKETLQRELEKDKSLMCETTNELRDREDSAGLKDEVCEEVKSGLTTLKENCVQRERKQFTAPENVERLERLDGEINPFISEVEEVVDDVDLLMTDGYVAKESIDDVAIGDYLTDDRSILLEQSRGIT